MSSELLVRTNLGWLSQARALLESMTDEQYAAHNTGGQMRHALEFYQCFLQGLPHGHINYDARRRDPQVEQCRRTALALADRLARQLQEVALMAVDHPLRVRMEDASPDDPELLSSVGRELQVLSSHTVHHFAILALALPAAIEMSPTFGVAPSTLRYRAGLRQETA
jgi:hypothetical protein